MLIVGSRRKRMPSGSATPPVYCPSERWAGDEYTPFSAWGTAIASAWLM